MGWSEMEARCRKHPSHRQSKGVCPSCLTEKLSRLDATSPSTTTNASSTPTPLFDTASSSASRGSPRKKGKQAGAMVSLLPEEPLTKSRSLAFVITAGEGGKEEEKRRGFWGRLLVVGKERKRKGAEKEKKVRKKDAMLHSKTVNERSSASWIL